LLQIDGGRSETQRRVHFIGAPIVIAAAWHPVSATTSPRQRRSISSAVISIRRRPHDLLPFGVP